MNEVCVYQGTFNPIHNAHINVALKVHDVFNFDKIVFIPAFRPPHKNVDEFGTENAFHRLNMVEIAVKKYQFFDVSAVEYLRNEPSYTYNTILFIKNTVKTDKKINFIIGTDAFKQIESWHKSDELKKLVKFILFVRESDFDETPYINLKNKGYEYQLIDFPFNDISSCEIRKKISLGEDVCDMIPKEVAEYIKKYDVYKTGH